MESTDETADSGPERRRKGILILSLIGAVAVLTGTLTLLTSPGPESIAWFAYTPLSDASFSPGGMLLTPQAAIGLLVGVLGLVALAFAGGWALGRRRQATGRGTEV
jgi:heme/copper-type cytochrome/quinol oxidase subunit 1